MEVNNQEIRYIMQFCFDKDKKAIQMTEIVNADYGPDTVTPIYPQIWFYRFRSRFLMFNMHFVQASPPSKMSIKLWK